MCAGVYIGRGRRVPAGWFAAGLAGEGWVSIEASLMLVVRPDMERGLLYLGTDGQHCVAEEEP